MKFSTLRQRIQVEAADVALLLRLIVVAAAYVVFAKIGFELAFATKQVTAVWPPTGIAVAALLLWGYRVWPGIWLGAFIGNAISDEPLLTAAGIATGNTFGPLFAAILLRKFAGFDNTLARVRDVLALAALGAAAAMCVTATNGVVNLALARLIPWSATPSAWWVWWFGDAMGVLLVAPLLLTWASDYRITWRPAKLLELALLVPLLAAAAFYSLTINLPLAYPVFPFVIWTALRFGQRECASAIVLISVIAIWGAIHDRGPFVSGSLDQRLILLVTFMAALALTGLVLGAATLERERAKQGERRMASAKEAAEQLSREERHKRELERQKYRVKKIEALATLAAGAAHELNNALLPIVVLAQSVALKLAEGSRERENLRLVVAGAERARELVKQISSFSRLDEMPKGPVALAKLTNATLAPLKAHFPTIVIDQRVSADPIVFANESQLGQVLINLVTNAAQAIGGDPGMITLEISVDRDEKGSPAMARVAIVDNGPGMDEKTLERLFEPFFTTKPVGEGTGLGLAAAHGIIAGHAGRIEVTSRPGRGARFDILLPIYNAEAACLTDPANDSEDGVAMALFSGDFERLDGEMPSRWSS